MELVVHIGTYKTGTTYLQRFMQQQYATFDKLGIYIPQMGRDVASRPAFHNLAWELIGSPQFREDHGTIDQLADDLIEHRPQKALVSSEVLATALLSNEFGAASRARFTALADRVGARLHYVIFVRDQAEVMNSAYCQNIKQLVATKSFEDWTTGRSSHSRLDYLTWVTPLIEDPNVDFTAVNYAEARDTGLLPTLLSVVGAAPESADDFGDLHTQHNTSPGPATVAVGRALATLARSDPTFAWYRPRYKRLSRSLIRHGDRLGLNASGFWGWTPERAQLCATTFGEGNEAFAQRLWDRSWPSAAAERPQNVLSLADALDHFDHRAKSDLFGSVATSVFKNLD